MVVSTLAHMHHVGCGAMIGRAPGPAFHHLSKQQRVRLSTAMRVLDAYIASGSYCIIAEALFAQRRIPDRAWKMHDLRNRTIRLVQSDLALMRTIAQAAAAEAHGLTSSSVGGIGKSSRHLRHPHKQFYYAIVTVDARRRTPALKTITELIKCPTGARISRSDTCAHPKQRAF
ncbi:DUF2285 domain-containing protein [Bradyrhizobium sp. NAS96.2]|uniref:DUF2285 domain-containing protein n=1 Tax=Bradyrhizobium sp. NAS96.2 TaxID=1680160 RepID=UPI00093D1881|nr:DUF2285 domain-containing protein [Bradyrhizobium sp. NAS96.2]